MKNGAVNYQFTINYKKKENNSYYGNETSIIKD